MITARCAACGSADWSAAGTWKGYRLAACARCGLTFTLNPDYSPQRYAAAYDGTSSQGPVEERHSFVYTSPARRLGLEAAAFFPPSPRLTQAQMLALRRLRADAPRGAPVIDCGCGSGAFLWALGRAGIKGVGVEISAEIISLLHARGLEAVQGKAPDFPWIGPEPYALTFFEVLEHFPDPSAVIRALKERFPRARILASVPSPLRPGLLLHGRRGLSDRPPNHFLMWTPRALQLFFTRMGYGRAKVTVFPPIGSELMPGVGQMLAGVHGARRGPAPGGQTRRARPSAGKRAAAAFILWMQRSYQALMDVAGAARALAARARGASANSMLVDARPEPPQGSGKPE